MLPAGTAVELVVPVEVAELVENTVCNLRTTTGRTAVHNLFDLHI
jgi:hypothetical protein